MELAGKVDAEDAGSKSPFFFIIYVKYVGQAETGIESALFDNQNIEIMALALFEKHEL
jgi:hypothetical protein